MDFATDSAVTIDGPQQVVRLLREDGWRVIAAVERDGALVTREIASADALPRGRVDELGPGHCRLVDGPPGRWFDHVIGPGGWKEWLFPPREKLWSAQREGQAVTFDDAPQPWPKTAFFGVRPCDLAAIARQDRVFSTGPGDPAYAHRRAAVLIVAVNCARAAPTCFCASMGTGPRAEQGFDLALSELDGRFVVETGSTAGAALAARLDAIPATEDDLAAAAAMSRRTAETQTRHMPAGIAGTLRSAPEHPAWDDVAARCLACANCTLACPTCFCSDVEDVTDLTGDHAERWRHWDSCFSPEFSLVGGGAVRASTRARYRQWMTHKLSSWHDQFGESGCVGCGRCIAWCPVGIDITQEARALSTEETPA
ncbi:sulfhydrogenase subunit beta (sulfur reductase) [Rhodovulum iodosum]|uniref:Sulfhydrogenase subunit beta (Sulfur reductase) n=1 Tax=Rhodovulum iodosum TaxID=68291 RepID=A0ABV3XTV6_9RHOB|nr:4Fe-4S dicluster domain-containing protein [Rhodovulum robiginosum]RSK32206.1 hypothetical protein EJA01_13385 [Rhodovulum robiginosum]